jgi:hypothetical protein
MKSIRSIVCLIAIAYLGIFALAQSPTGTIQGVVTDKTGAAVQGATITIVRTTTNAVHKAATDASGRYTFVFVEPGVYNISAEAASFQVAKQNGVLVQVTETRPVNFKLEVSGVTQTVEVSATAESLDTQTSTMGQTVQTETLLQLPDNGRNPFDVATLVPGVNNVGDTGIPHIGGSRNGNNEQLIDGMTNIAPENNVGNNSNVYQPVEDSVQEINVQTSVLPAEYGRFSGGTESLVTKSGGNQWHGSYFEFLQQGATDAAPFGAPHSANSNSKPDMHQYQSGGTASGPIIKNKAFFFFDYEYTSAASGSTYYDVVPDPSTYSGDFTSLFGTTTPVLYDPDTVAKDASGNYVRQPFKGSNGDYNVIPEKRISKVTQAAMKYYPKPNIDGASAGSNNYKVALSVPSSNWHFDSREDVDVTSKWHAFLRYSMAYSKYSTNDDFQNAASNGNWGGNGHGYTYSGSFNNTVSFSPTLLGEFRYGYSRSTTNRVPVGGNFDPATLGFDSNYSAQAAKRLQIFPHFAFSGANNGSFTDLGSQGWEGMQEDPAAQSINGSLVKIHGPHTFKVGGEFRQLRLSFYQWVYPSGTYSSDDSWTRQAPQTYDGTTGYALASFLLGLPSSGYITNDPTTISTSQYLAFYGQDDWKISPKVTLNFGLRYDLEIPRVEKDNQMVYWDQTATSPLQAYSSNISSALTAAGETCPYCSNLKGAMSIVGASGSKYGRRQAPVQKVDFAPRLGLAYNPTPNIVVRAGAGIVYQPSALQAAGTTGGGMDGFQGLTNFYSTYDNQTSLPVASLYSPDSNLSSSAKTPFPSGYTSAQAKNATCLASSACVQGIDIGAALQSPYFDTYRNPYSIQWNANVQFSMPWSVKVQVGYLANRGLFLINGDPGLPVDQLTTDTLTKYGCTPGASTSSCALSQQVANPFYSELTSGSPFYIPGLALGGTTVSAAQLQHRYPQYSSVSTYRKPDSDSMYNGFTFSANKTASKGLTFTYAFTYGKEYDNAASPVNYLGAASQTYANQYNPKAEWGIGAQNVLWDNAASFVYELPLGHGHTFLNTGGNPFTDKLLAGWQISGIESYLAGTPVTLSSIDNGTTQETYGGMSQRPNWAGVSPKLTNKGYKLWFNPDVYSVPLSYEIGNAPRTIGVNNPSTQDLDLQFAKNTTFGVQERYRVQLRVEMFNALNHPNLGNPGTSVSNSSTFGVIQSYSGTARRLQFAAKFNF